MLCGTRDLAGRGAERPRMRRISKNRTKNVRFGVDLVGRVRLSARAGARTSKNNTKNVRFFIDLAGRGAEAFAPTPHTFLHTYRIALKLSSAACSVLSMSASVWAVVRNQASYLEGAR